MVEGDFGMGKTVKVGQDLCVRKVFTRLYGQMRQFWVGETILDDQEVWVG